MSDGTSASTAERGDRDGTGPGEVVRDEAAVRTLGGKWLVLVLYVVVVAIAGLTGLMIGGLGIRGLRPVTFLGLVTFQPTPVGLAAYGALTMGGGLGVLLGLVVYVSDRYIDEE